MRVVPTILSLLPVTYAVNVVLSNDDGWAEINIRQFYKDLTNAGENVVISAPADNKSGTGSTDEPPAPRTTPCEFNSCPANSPAVGFNASMPRFNYVNSYPATSIRYGINNVSAKFFDGPPDIAVAGFNVGANLGATTLISGTVGAATEASKEGVPAIAFSGSSGSQIAWNVSPVPNYVKVYSELSTNVTETLIASGTPYLAMSTWLNVNFPTSNDSTCNSPSQFKFILSRINAATGATDVETCNNGGTLPTESSVVATPGCYASISVGDAATKGDVDADAQFVALMKLQDILSCLPSEDTAQKHYVA
ncbi:MAG: hypothetical protein Q9227_003862 [Pyrenula ochraceoflavens]